MKSNKPLHIAIYHFGDLADIDIAEIIENCPSLIDTKILCMGPNVYTRHCFKLTHHVNVDNKNTLFEHHYELI